MAEIIKWKPGNAAEADRFIAQWCERCSNCKEWEGCPIHLDGLFYGVDEPDYPAQWQIGPDGAQCCTDFEALDPSRPLATPEELEAAGQTRLLP